MRTALAFALAGVGVLLWQFVTASLEPPPLEAAHSALETPRPRPRPHMLPKGVPVLGASIASVSFPRRGVTLPWGKAHVLPVTLPPLVVEATLSSASPPPAPPSRTVLPSVSEERAADGLPVSAMRCTPSAQGLDCGSCRADGDCPPRQGCVANRETRRFECMASECEEDAHCFPGSVCRPVNTGATGTVIRRCVPEGTRNEGESCDAVAVSSLGSCREGLRCVNQRCSTPCQPGGLAACPSGYVCTDGLDGAGCVPDCQRLGCPDGQRCSRVREGEFQCLAESEGDCRDTPCPEGERCNLRMSRGRAVFWCARVCNSMLPASCPTGQVCGMGSATASTCFRQCDPADVNACGPGWVCSTVSEDMSVFGCTPALGR